jgi:hypothetical protein
MISSDQLQIPSCPICKETHLYSLQVERTFSFAYTITQLPLETRRHFTRLFTCPKDGERFQVRFSLTETQSAKIKSVEDGGVVTEEDDEQE